MAHVSKTILGLTILTEKDEYWITPAVFKALLLGKKSHRVSLTDSNIKAKISCPNPIGDRDLILSRADNVTEFIPGGLNQLVEANQQETEDLGGGNQDLVFI